MITKKDIGRFVCRRDFPDAVGKVTAVDVEKGKCYVYFFSEGKKFLLPVSIGDLEMVVGKERIKKLQKEFKAAKKRGT